MSHAAEGPEPGAFDEAQAQAYAAAMEIETTFPHDHACVALLRRHARGAALDLGGGTGRYAAWLLHMGLVTSAQVIDQSPTMIATCLRRDVPGLRAQVGDIETVDLGRDRYDFVLARFVLMHVRDLARTLQRVALSLKAPGALVVITNVVEGTPAAVAAFHEATAGIMTLQLQVHGTAVPVANYVRTRDDYCHAIHQAGLRIASCATYAPHIVRFETAPLGVTLAHLVLLGKKEAIGSSRS